MREVVAFLLVLRSLASAGFRVDPRVLFSRFSLKLYCSYRFLAGYGWYLVSLLPASRIHREATRKPTRWDDLFSPPHDARSLD